MEDKFRKTQSDDAVAPYVEEESNAMKVLRGTGEENSNPHESKIGGKKVSKIEDFWYRHKWHAAISISAIVIAIVVILQIILRVSPDVYIMYTGPQAIIGARYEKLEAAILSIMDDYNEDGKLKMGFTDNTVLTKEQIEERQAADSGYKADYQANSAAFQRHTVEVAAAKHGLLMLDPAYFESLAASGAFKPLSEIFEEIPPSARGEYGITLGKTEFYNSNSEIQFLPADTVLAVRCADALDFKSEEKREAYIADYADLLREIVEFRDKNS